MAILDFEGLQYFFSGLKSIFAAKSHTHDERYYTESEMDGKLAGKSNTGHTHDLSAMINTLTTGGSVPVDADFYISQYVGGGTTTTSYHRRPMSALWNYIKGKTDAAYLKLTGGTISGALHLKQPNSGSYNENIRMHPSKSDWSSIVMCGSDNTGDSGTSAKTWGIFTNGGKFGISKNGNGVSNVGDASLVCGDNNVWKANGNELITSATIGAQTVNTAKKVADSNNSKATTFAYSKSGMNYTDYTWLAAWNGYELRAVNKSQFAQAGHTHTSINSLGAKNAQTGRTQAYGNVYSYNSNASAHNGMPTTYTSTIGFGCGAGGTVELCGEWTGGRGLWTRALRDTTDNWFSWQRIYTDNYHPIADVANSVAWNNVSGRPDLYTKAQVDQLLKKAMYSEGKLVYTGMCAFSYNSDGNVTVPSSTDYVKLKVKYDNATFTTMHGSSSAYSGFDNTKLVKGGELSNSNLKITFYTSGKITFVGYYSTSKSATAGYYIEAYQYY